MTRQTGRNPGLHPRHFDMWKSGPVYFEKKVDLAGVETYFCLSMPFHLLCMGPLCTTKTRPMDPLTRGTLCIETSRLSTCFTLFFEMRPNDLYKWCETSLIQKIDTPRASVSSWTWYSACVPVVLADFVLKEDLRVFIITNYHLFSDLWAHCHILSLGHTATQRNLEAEGLEGDRWPTCAMLGINILVSGEGSVELLLVTALTSWNGQNDEMMRASFQHLKPWF
jgi:hypothetical protein